MATEIERKFLATIPESVDQWPSANIVQGYLIVTDDGHEVRLRKKGGQHYLTIKSGGDAERAEAEIMLLPPQFKALWPLTEGKRIEKVRYRSEWEGTIIELDVYHGHLEGLVIAEVEFRSLEESRRFVSPPWFGVEVTKDNRYKNKHLASRGFPQ